MVLLLLLPLMVLLSLIHHYLLSLLIILVYLPNEYCMTSGQVSFFFKGKESAASSFFGKRQQEIQEKGTFSSNQCTDSLHSCKILKTLGSRNDLHSMKRKLRLRDGLLIWEKLRHLLRPGKEIILTSRHFLVFGRC